ncbi:MAG: hypothetical protein A3G59_00195 [Candidatus Taylorbacteria bacterium RIFCSPLOWO2_12_FULL_47_20]|uniref:Uncharacterized protein n=2 Tax=Candidatus Tayloriibacteriota TaxID=1817919 RepID=A0A1G2P7A1_9BACT|nr:MAG: hypothetical protein A3H68_00580 [Candidatus Taylorbacteria bacterium RIFCSPLOWO2_02_FULL_46_40]OHA44225.1 MAG: hypothetical protein A3G59_00195 [Candidatus Taylorbacteria bacterium RIFCSPLOWO2_12_FULL_47_20]
MNPIDIKKLYLDNAKNIYRYCRVFSGDTSYCEEKTQEIFLRICEKSLKPNFYSLNAVVELYRIARKTLRKKSVFSYKKKQDSVGDGSVLENQSGATKPENLKTDIYKSVLSAISDDFREAVALYLVCGLSVENISLILDMPPTGVKVRIKKAEAGIKGAFGNNAPQEFVSELNGKNIPAIAFKEGGELINQFLAEFAPVLLPENAKQNENLRLSSVEKRDKIVASKDPLKLSETTEKRGYARYVAATIFLIVVIILVLSSLFSRTASSPSLNANNEFVTAGSVSAGANLANDKMAGLFAALYANSFNADLPETQKAISEFSEFVVGYDRVLRDVVLKISAGPAEPALQINILDIINAGAFLKGALAGFESASISVAEDNRFSPESVVQIVSKISAEGETITDSMNELLQGIDQSLGLALVLAENTLGLIENISIGEDADSENDGSALAYKNSRILDALVWAGAARELLSNGRVGDSLMASIQALQLLEDGRFYERLFFDLKTE